MNFSFLLSWMRNQQQQLLFSFLFLLLLLLLLFLVGEPRFSLFPPNQGFVTTAPQPRTEDLAIYQEEILNPQTDYHISHVASLCELPDGRLVTAWYGGSEESMPDVKIYFSRQEKETHSEQNLANSSFLSSWSSPKVIMTREKALHHLGRFVRVVGNPLLFCDREGTLHLLYITVGIGKWSGSQLNIMSSYDEGRNWELEDHLQLAPLFNFAEVIKNPPTPLLPPSGKKTAEIESWAIPIHQELLGKFPEILWLSKEGKNWRAVKSRVAGGCSYLQPTLAPLSQDEAVMLFRDYRKAHEVTLATTHDGGKSWSHPQGIGLPNDDNGLCVLTLSNGWLLLAFDDAPTSRDCLRLALSTDQGKSWQRLATIAQEKNGDFSYPYFCQTRDGMIHLLYTYKRTHIHHVWFNLPWVENAAKHLMK